MTKKIIIFKQAAAPRGMPATEKGPYCDPLKIKIWKIVFLHAREDQKIGLESSFHESRSSNSLD